MFKVAAKSLFFIAAILINLLPTFMAFCGPKFHHHTHSSTKHAGIRQASVETGLHDTSWDLVRKKHLSVPPVHLKVRPIFAICLLFSLFFSSKAFLQTQHSFLKVIPGESPAPSYERYLRLRSFLI